MQVGTGCRRPIDESGSVCTGRELLYIGYLIALPPWSSIEGIGHVVTGHHRSVDQDERLVGRHDLATRSRSRRSFKLGLLISHAIASCRTCGRRAPRIHCNYRTLSPQLDRVRIRSRYCLLPGWPLQSRSRCSVSCGIERLGEKKLPRNGYRTSDHNPCEPCSRRACCGCTMLNLPTFGQGSRSLDRSLRGRAPRTHSPVR